MTPRRENKSFYSEHLADSDSDYTYDELIFRNGHNPRHEPSEPRAVLTTDTASGTCAWVVRDVNRKILARGRTKRRVDALNDLMKAYINAVPAARYASEHMDPLAKLKFMQISY